MCVLALEQQQQRYYFFSMEGAPLKETDEIRSLFRLHHSSIPDLRYPAFYVLYACLQSRLTSGDYYSQGPVDVMTSLSNRQYLYKGFLILFRQKLAHFWRCSTFCFLYFWYCLPLPVSYQVSYSLSPFQFTRSNIMCQDYCPRQKHITAMRWILASFHEQYF